MGSLQIGSRIRRSGLWKRMALLFVVGGLAVVNSGCFALPYILYWYGALRSEDIGMGAGAQVASMATAGSALFIPAGAHVSGALGTNWKTEIEVANAGTVQASFTIALLKANQANPSPQTKSLQLGPGRSVRYDDALASLFSFSGSAALRIAVDSGMIAVTSRTYNDTPSGTYGQFIGGVLQETAVRAGQEGRIIQLSHSRSSSSGYRTNIGFDNATGASLKLDVELYLADGSFLGTRSYTLGPYEFRQVGKIFESVTSSDVADGYAVLSTSIPGGRFFAYASVIDNRTGDPIYITPSVRQRGGAPPQPSPTPTPTPTAQGPNLKPYQPAGWMAPLVASGTTDTSVSGSLVGGQPTYFDWALANYGPGDVHFNSGDPLVEFRLDGSAVVGFAAPEGGFTLEEGHYAYYQDFEVDNIPAGLHSGELIGDPNALVAESDEGDNSYSASWTWGSGPSASWETDRSIRRTRAPVLTRRLPSWDERVTRAHGRPAGMGRPGQEPLAPDSLLSQGIRSTASMGVLYIPAAAHITGAQGTNWRTDMEIHNPGAVQGRYEIALLKRNQDNSNPETRTVTVRAGRSLRLKDVLSTKFNFSGAAALRITPLEGEAIVTSRTYNLTASGTYGQFIPGFPLATALAGAESALQIQLSHQPGGGSGFRTNIGLLNCTGGTITVDAAFHNSSGSSYGTKSYTLRPYEFTQVDKIFEAVTGNAVVDGYISLTSGTAGALFFGYASIIDNRTGDPVFAPAIPVPRREPAPVPVDEVGDAVMTALGLLGQGGTPSLVDMISEIQQQGMESYLDGAASLAPDVVMRIPSGLRYTFGSHFVLADGSAASGSIDWTYQNLVNSGGVQSYDYELSLENLRLNGQYLEIDTFTGSVDMTINSGVVAGDLSIDGSSAGTLSVGDVSSASISGSAHIDTSVCPRYPVSGSVTVTRDGKDSIITFTGACDGSFDYQGPGQGGQPGDISFRLTWSGRQDVNLYVKEPSGEIIYWFHPASATGGRLDNTQGNEFCDTHSSRPEESVSWPSGTAPRGSYEVWAGMSDQCDDSSMTAGFTIEVYDGTTLVKTFTGSVFEDDVSPHYTYVY